MTNYKNDELSAAEDYRVQQQIRYDKAAVELFKRNIIEKFDEALLHFQKFNPELTREMFEDYLSPTGSASTELDEHYAYFGVLSLCELIEQSAEKNNLPLHAGVAAGVVMRSGIAATQERVMMTEASVITMSSDLMILINRIAKLLALSIPIESREDGTHVPQYDFVAVLDQINKTENLRAYWIRLFMDYSKNFKSPSAGEVIVITNEDQQTLWIDFDEAMNLFVLGHEYGHHIAKHSLGGQIGAEWDDSISMHHNELEADLLATILSTSAGQLTDRPNYCALTGLGAVVILTVLDCIRKGESILKTGRADIGNESQTHPPLEKRLEIIRDYITHFIGDKGIETVRTMHNCIHDLINTAWDNSAEELSKAYQDGVRPPNDSPQDWLPS